MTTADRVRHSRKPSIDAAAQIAATDEILQVMFWLRGEGFAHEVSPYDLSKWVGLSAREIEPLLVQMLGSHLVERVLVDSGAEEGMPRFRLTQRGATPFCRGVFRAHPPAISSTAIRIAIARTFPVLVFR
ncbi:hypothetical protein BH20VER3_BH20VER3_04390 [soil metagenome]